MGDMVIDDYEFATKNTSHQGQRQDDCRNHQDLVMECVMLHIRDVPCNEIIKSTYPTEVKRNS